MKPSAEDRANLAARIVRARQICGLTNAEIALKASVDPGQTSRILAGRFRTISGNVLQICNVLGFDAQVDGMRSDASSRSTSTEVAWARLEASVRRAWDETPAGAERLARVIDAVAEVGRR